ncbi:MAG: DUF3575 domain-containing protein [Bacteroidota bacterium]
MKYLTLVLAFAFSLPLMAQKNMFSLNAQYGSFDQSAILKGVETHGGFTVGFQHRINQHFSLGGNAAWSRLKNKVYTFGSTPSQGSFSVEDKAQLFIIRPELRYYLNSPFQGLYGGVALIGCQYHVQSEGETLTPKTQTSNDRGSGAGLLAGYQLHVKAGFGLFLEARYDWMWLGSKGLNPGASKNFGLGIGVGF